MTTTPELSTPLRDVITIPERVHAADFVLQLNDGVSEAGAARTLADYVVTDSLRGSFGEALDLVETALRNDRSRGAFIHGSFGSGKSHFMAVLDLVLTGHPGARALPGIQQVIADHPTALGANLLAVDYHLLGSDSLEQALFSGYAQLVRQRHPEAPAPVLHRSDSLLADADALRERLGDDAFFGALGGDSDSGWGDMSSGWDAQRYDNARTQGPEGAERQDLVRALVDAYFRNATTTGTWLDMQAGLRAMTAHAKSLGYDGVVLFLDELVLWLGQHLGDATFIQRETSKVTKLVETDAGLAVPVISFVARQRELKGFLAGSNVGAEQVNIGDSFRHWEDRFDKINLQAADLPEIVQKRLLQPKDDAAATALAAAHARVSANSTALRYLLDDELGSNVDDFRQVYPFSPALVDAMIALSTILQRERTALKIMSELLSRGRDELTVGDVIGVGDLFDVVVLGDTKPLTDDMAKLFEIAARFYRDKVRPFLLDKNGLTESQTVGLARNHPFRTEDRILKTLLVAALAPGATSLKTLTASKLAALNYGSVTAFVPGTEASQVVALAQRWSREFGEISLGSGTDPVITLQLSGVDYDALLDRVQGEDTPGARRTLLRQLLLSELGTSTTGGLMEETLFRHVWRGDRHEAELVFGNVRDDTMVGPDKFRATPDRWRVVVDYPFDDGPDHAPTDDVARVEALRAEGLSSTTVVWIPHFLTSARMDDVGTLVQLEHLLSGRHFDDNAVILAVNEREPARRALQGRRDSLRDGLLTALRQAYAVQAATDEHISRRLAPGENFLSLDDGGTISSPAAQSLQAGLTQVLHQLLERQYPNHPDVGNPESEVRASELNAVLAQVRRATASGGRVEGLERSLVNSTRRVVEGYGIGVLRENVYSLTSANFSWWDRFTRWAAGSTEVGVPTLRDELRPYGLTTAVEDLLILTWAALADREIWQHESRVTPGLGELRPTTSLREPVLPDAGVWEESLNRAKRLFGVGGSEVHLTSAAVQRVAEGVRTKLAAVQRPVAALPSLLESHAGTLGLDVGAPVGRFATAARAKDLTELLLAQREPVTVLNELAGFDLPNEPQALAASISTAADVGAALSGGNWSILNQVTSLGADADSIRERLRAAATQDELHTALAPALHEAADAITGLLVARRTVEPVPTPPIPGSPTPPGPTPERGGGEAVAGHLTVNSAGDIEELAIQLRGLLRDAGGQIDVTWRRP